MSTSGATVEPTQAVQAGTKNAIRTIMEALRQESTDGVLRTTSTSPGYVRTELIDSIENPSVRERAQKSMADLGIDPSAVAREIAFAIDQPDDVETGDLIIRPSRQGWAGPDNDGRLLAGQETTVSRTRVGAVFYRSGCAAGLVPCALSGDCPGDGGAAVHRVFPTDTHVRGTARRGATTACRCARDPEPG